jgi:predicted Zn-dependent protease
MARELSGDPEGALDALAPLRTARPSDPILAVRAAGLLLAAGRTDEARAAAAVAGSNGPSAALAAAVKAEILRQQGDCDAAARAATAALSTAPESSALRRVRGICRFDAGDQAGAEADLQAVAAADPTDAGARYLLGALAAMSGKLDVAEEQMSALPEPLRSEALGRLRYQQGRYAETIDLLGLDRSAEARLLLADATLREEGPSPAVRALLAEAAAGLPGDRRVHRIRSALLMAEGDVSAALTEMLAARGSADSAVHWR